MLMPFLYNGKLMAHSATSVILPRTGVKKLPEAQIYLKTITMYQDAVPSWAVLVKQYQVKSYVHPNSKTIKVFHDSNMPEKQMSHCHTD